MHVALLGGSYNPPHVGHLAIATWARGVLECDQVWLLPAFQHPFGKALIDFDHRVAMCRSMANWVGDWMQVHPYEREAPGQGRTVELLEYLHQRFPEHRYTLLVGSDVWREFPLWKNAERVQQLARVVVVSRQSASSEVALGPALCEVSSSDVRQRLRDGRDISGFVPAAVQRYIRYHNLYLEGDVSVSETHNTPAVVRVVAAMIERGDGAYLITQRNAKAVYPSLWEFPGGRALAGEPDDVALQREVNERLGAKVQVLDLVSTRRHRYPNYDLDFCIYRCALMAGEDRQMRDVGVAAHRWVRLEELADYSFPPADEASIARLLGLDEP